MSSHFRSGTNNSSGRIISGSIHSGTVKVAVAVRTSAVTDSITQVNISITHERFYKYFIGGAKRRLTKKLGGLGFGDSFVVSVCLLKLTAQGGGVRWCISKFVLVVCT